MYNLRGTNFDGYPAEALEQYETVLDKITEAQIEESPLGVTLLDITAQDIEVLKAVFGRNNGFKVPHEVKIKPIVVYVDAPQPEYVYKLTRLQHLYRTIFGDNGKRV